jgi:hypothetical protein
MTDNYDLNDFVRTATSKALLELAEKMAEQGRVPAPGAALHWEEAEGPGTDLVLVIDTIPDPDLPHTQEVPD